MPTPMQRHIISLIALMGGSTTLSHIIAETKSNYEAVDAFLRKMVHDGLINRSKGTIWLTMRGINEYEFPSYRKCTLCDNRHFARGYCILHYGRWRRGTL